MDLNPDSCGPSVCFVVDNCKTGIGRLLHLAQCVQKDMSDSCLL